MSIGYAFRRGPAISDIQPHFAKCSENKKIGLHRMRTIAIANQKGGCGKTTVSINLAACLAREGRRTLAVDLDPQSHLALGLAVPEEQIEVSITDILAEPAAETPPDLSRVTWQISSNFDLIPSKTDLARLERELAADQSREIRLHAALESAREKYDYVIIDTPPTPGFLTDSALYAADEVIVPVDTGYFSLHGLSKQLDTIRLRRDQWQRPLTLRILANHYDVRTKLAREVLSEMRKRHGDAMFSTFINFNTKLKESASLGQPITEYDPASSGCRDFVKFAREVIALNEAATATKPTIVLDPGTDKIKAAQRQQQQQHAAAPVTPEQQSLLQRADQLAADANQLLATSQTLIGPGRPLPSPEPVAAPAQAATVDQPVTVVPSQSGAPQAATVQAVATLDPARPVHDPAATARKIDRIYGPMALDDGCLFVIRVGNASRVQIAGDFNDWNPDRTPLQYVDRDMFQIKVPLRPGRYQYRYVVDGDWRNDPENHNVELNPYGELNNVVEIVG